MTISGLYLDGSTSVTFGSTPASSFSVDSANQITAIAPPSVASTVDVRVSGPGGSSAVSASDRYSSLAPTTTTTPSSTTPSIAPIAPIAKPTLSGAGESARKWRRGKALPHISSAGTPVGTTFSFALNEPASVSLAFSQRVTGRRVKGRCVAVSAANAAKPKCKRTISAGSFSLSAHAGLDKVKFQGRLSSSKTLKPGTYLVSITARDSRGVRSAAQSLSFTIVS